MNIKKEKIGVLMGGVSSERDISLISGKTVYEALLRKGYEVIPLALNGKNAIKPIKTPPTGTSKPFTAGIVAQNIATYIPQIKTV